MPNVNDKAVEKEADVTLVHGPSGSGKTWAAGTISSKFLVRPPAERTSLIILDDILWVQFDRTGLQTLQSLGMEPYYLDFSAQPVDALKWIKAVMARLETLPQLMADKNIKAIVIDTISTMASYLDNYFLTTTPNAQLGYGRSQQAFRQIMTQFRALQVPQVWLCHSKSAYIPEEDPTADSKKALMNSTRPFEYQTDLALVRGIGDYVRPIPNVSTFVQVVDGKRRLVLKEGTYAYTKNRFGDLLPDHMPVDLAALFKKVEEAEARMRATPTK